MHRPCVHACGPKACCVTSCFFLPIGGWLWGEVVPLLTQGLLQNRGEMRQTPEAM